MKLLSNDLRNGSEMPSEFTCEGSDISPELHWAGVPSGAKSFAIILRDPDAPSGDFAHWLVCNIPASAASIPKGGPLPKGAVQVVNDFGKKAYGGPCPPSGTHRYVFRLYALGVESVDCGSKQQFLQAVEQHKIGEAALLAPYKRK